MIRQAITGGQAVIEGLSSVEEASEIALVLRSGSLPVPLKVAEIRAIGPTLGQDAIQAGIRSALIGTLAIFLLIFAYYGPHLGLVASLGLLYTSALILGLLSGLGATLTLPGIAGLVLTLGAAVDGNVLSFERIKEELRAGKKLRQAIPEGFRHSTLTIMDVNIAHLLAAAALYQYATGPVRGFAVILAIGVVASVFSTSSSAATSWSAWPTGARSAPPCGSWTRGSTSWAPPATSRRPPSSSPLWRRAWSSPRASTTPLTSPGGQPTPCGPSPTWRWRR